MLSSAFHVIRRQKYSIPCSISVTGKYCIYKRRRQCPAGLASCELFWDDEENANRNDDGGTLPEGKYNHDTVIYFCYKTNGSKDDPIALPVKSPFFSSGVWVGKMPDGQVGCIFCGVDILRHRRLGRRRSTWCVPLQRWKKSSHHLLLLLSRWESISYDCVKIRNKS